MLDTNHACDECYNRRLNRGASHRADSSDEEDDVSAAPLYQRPAAVAEAPKEEESVDENEDTEEDEETEEEEQEEIVVSKKPAKSAPTMQLSKKDMKKKEMADLDSILAELGTPSPAAAVQEVKPPMPVKEAASNAVEVEVSMEELSILGIDTAASSSKKKRKKKKKKKKNNSGSATADATSAAAAATSTAAGDTSATASSTTSKPVLSKQDVKAKLRGKIKKKKHGSNKAAAAAKREAVKRKVMSHSLLVQLSCEFRLSQHSAICVQVTGCL